MSRLRPEEYVIVNLGCQKLLKVYASKFIMIIVWLWLDVLFIFLLQVTRGWIFFANSNPIFIFSSTSRKDPTWRTKHLRVWKPLSCRRILETETLKGSSEGKVQKGQICASGGHALLQMVLEPDTGWCATEDIGPWREVDCELPHRLERGTKHWCGNLSLALMWELLHNRSILKTLRGSPNWTISTRCELYIKVEFKVYTPWRIKLI